MVIEYAFADFVSGLSYYPHDQYCTREIREDAEQRAHDLLNGFLGNAVMDLFPDLFGGVAEDPPWAWRDPDGYEAEIRKREEDADTDQAQLEKLKLALARQRELDAEAQL